MSSSVLPNLLLVDDEPKNLLALEAVLGPLGENLIRANSGQEALQHVLSTDFAVILLDVGMPTMSGMETAKLIRASPRSKGTPIIFLTASDGSDLDVEESYALGAVDHLTKPVVSSVLRGKVEFLLELYRSKLALRDAERRAVETAFREHQELWQMTLSSIGDAVIATDTARRVTFFNAEAERLTGWTRADALGKELDEVFRIVNEETRMKVSCPVRKVLETGRVVGLANHTLLIRRDGTERPIDDSAAPIRDPAGELYGVVLVFRDITEKYQADRRLREARDELEARVAERTAELQQEKLFLEAVLENIEDGIVACDGNGVLTLFNRATKNLHGLPQEPLPPEHWAQHYDLFEADGTTPLAKAQVPLFRALAGEFVKDARMVIAPTGGEPRLLLASGQPLHDATGHQLGAVVSMHDITDRRKAEEARAEVIREQDLRRSEERVGEVLESISDGFVLLDVDWQITYMNAAAERLTGQRREDLVGKNHWEVYPAAVGTKLYQEFLRTAKDRIPVSFENHYEPWDRWFELDASPAPAGGIAVYYRDITEKKRADAALRDSEERFRLLADTIPNLAWMAQPDGHIFWYNRRWYDYTGTTPEEMEGWGWKTVHHPDELPNVIEKWTKSIETGEPFKMVFPLRGANGEFRQFLTLVNPSREPGGEILFWFGTNTDITEQKLAEKRHLHTAEIEKKRSSLLNQVADASRSINTVMSAESISGILSQEARRIIGTHIAITSLVESDVANPAVRSVSLSKQAAGRLGRNPPPDGLAAHVCRTNLSMRLTAAELERHPEWDSTAHPTRGWIGVPLIGHGGRNVGLIQVSDKKEGDFTPEDEAILAQLAAIASVGLENARLYDSLREQDKRKDEFLATLAHELRNPLAPVRTGLEILKLADGTKGAAVARDMMERQLAHMVRLVDDLMDVSRVSRGQMELRPLRITIRTVFDMALETSRPLIEAARHELSVALSEEPLHVRADLARLAQMLSNLINNAAKYTPEGGRIQLSADRDDEQVVIRVTDSGVGIPSEMLSKIFDLFTQVGKTLERSQGGLGIGLSLVRRLVEMHGGTVGAESAGAGLGSTFTVRLPLDPASHADGEISASPPAPDQITSPQRRILIVDDNVDGAESLALLLQLTGHETSTVHHGLDVLRAALEFRPDLVFLDIGLPGMNGYEVALLLRQQAELSGTALVALTGWGSEEDRKRAHEAGFDGHLTKPVDPADVRKILQTCGVRKLP